MIKIRSILKDFFHPLFLLLLITSIFLIEMEYKYILFFLWSVFITTYSAVWKIKIKLKKDIILLGLFNIVIIISSIFSKLFFLSVDSVLFYLVSSSLYIFFRFLPKELNNKKEFFTHLSLMSLVLNILVITINFFPTIKNSFPGMNLLVKTYGHNHYSALLLLTIPVFWWQFFTKKKIVTSSLILIISSYLILFLSLGRISLLIALLQLVIIMKLKNKFFKNKINKKVNFIIKLLSTIISITLMGYLILGTPFINQEYCSLKKNDEIKKICQPISDNLRTSYWRKALLIAQKYPLSGYGPKTFNHAEKLFHQENETGTSYAHNIILHLLAEAGMFATFVFLLFFFYFFKTVLKYQKLDRLDYFLLIAISSSLVNALFDFDFNFFVIFSLSLIFMATIKNDKKKEKTNIYLSPYLLIITLTTLIFLFNYSLENYFLKNKNLKKAVLLIPSRNLKVGILNQISSDDNLNEKIFNRYLNDSSVLLHLKQFQSPNQELQNKINLQLIKIDLKSFLEIIDFSEYELELNNNIIEELRKKTSQGTNLNNYHLMTYKKISKLTNQIFNIAEENYQKNKLMEANNAYMLAIHFNEKIMAEKKAIFLEETNLTKAIQFLKLTEVSDKDMHEYSFEYTNLCKNTLQDLFLGKNIDDFYLIIDKNNLLDQKNSEYSYDQIFFLLKELVDLGQQNMNYENQIKLIYKNYKKNNIWERVFFEFANESEKVKYWLNN